MRPALRNPVICSLLLPIAFAFTTTLHAQKPAPSAAARTRQPVRGIRLFSGAPTASASGNRVYCGLTEVGKACANVNGGQFGGGGLWPQGTPDQYVFNSGLQITGVIPANAGFPWARDTVGAFAIDTHGPAEHTRSVTGMYDSRNPADTAQWPSGALVRDTSLFGAASIGRQAASLQDTWVRYWDGDTTLLTGRRHPAGLLVEQRTLQFDQPSGAQDILFVVFRLTNITASTASVYQSLAAEGYQQQDIANIAALGAEFQRQSERKFGVQIPDGGYTIDSAWVTMVTDFDVGDATNNYVTSALPFNLNVGWKSDFREATWQFPPEIFHAPLAAAPGFVGTAMVRTPAARGQTLWTEYAKTGSFVGVPAPATVPQGYRTAQGTVSPTLGDPNSCSFAPSRGFCYPGQAPSDKRSGQSSGPFSLAPGKSATLVVAYMMAPPLASNPGRPSFNLYQYVGTTNMLPGLPPAGDRLVQGLDTLRVLDAAMGWVSHSDQNANGRIDANEVTTVRGSLLQRAQLAQAMLDSHFAQPEPPAAPDFFLVPGSNKVTVVWQPSATETSGDPYYVLASNPASALYDPNYRQKDVEGYRVWRGTSPDNLVLLAQFDHDSTVFLDHDGDLVNGDYTNANGEYQCAPELGITGSCPAFPRPVPLAVGGVSFPGIVQVAEGGRSRVANDSATFARGIVRLDRADTAVTGGGSGFPALTDTGVPYVFVDSSAKNGARYYYAVTAFDVNSLRSGPSSLQSAFVVHGATPRVASGQETAGSLGPLEVVAANGAVLPSAALPTIDTATGIFSGPMPPTDAMLSLENYLSQVTGSGSVELFVDSIIAGDPLGTGAAGQYRMRVVSAGGVDTLLIPVSIGAFNQSGGTPNFVYDARVDAGPLDSASVARFGGGSGFRLFANVQFTVPGVFELAGPGRADANANPSRSAFTGPRWWTGAPNENTANPNSGNCAPAAGNCGPPPNPNRTAGALAGVTTLMNIQAYSTVPSIPMRNLEGIASYFYRAADFKVYWGGAGKVDSVVDVTHGVRVPFSSGLYASWGILNTAAFGATQAVGLDGNAATLTWMDVFCLAGATAVNGGGCVPGAGQTPPLLSQTAQLGSVYANGSAVGAAPAASGTGFIFYLAGKFFIMQMAALPNSGTTWNARYYTGNVRTSTQTGGTYSWVQSFRPPAVPGLHLRLSYTGSSYDLATTSDTMLAKVHTVPDPYYASSVQGDPNAPAVIRFVNVPAQSVVRIYSSSGQLVALLTHNDPTAGGELAWDVRSRGGHQVASGVYFYHVETPDHRTKIGRFVVVQ